MATTSVTSAVRTIKSALPEGRLSQDGNTNLLFGSSDQVQGFEDSRREIIGQLRSYANNDEDVGGSLRDFTALANPGWSLAYDGGARAKALAMEATKALCGAVYKHAGGLDGLISHQAGELFSAGASSCEWYPTPNRDSVKDVAVLGAENIVIRREGGELSFYQKRSDTHTLRQPTLTPHASVAGAFHQPNERAESRGAVARARPRTPAVTSQRFGTPLHPLTYRYIGWMPPGESLHGLPVIISALNALERKGRIDLGTERIIKLMGKGALVSVTIPKPTPQELGIETVDDPLYEEALGDYMREVADLVVQGQEEQLYFAYETESGKPDIKVHAYAGSANGLRELEIGNQLRVWSGVASTPFLRGYVESTTEALAKTMWLILAAHAVNVQPLLKAQVEFGLNLNLRLQGIAASVALTFDAPANPYEAQDAAADKTRAETDKQLIDMFGLDYLPVAAKRWGVVLGETRKELPDDMRTDLEPQDDAARTRGAAKAKEALETL